MLSCDMEHAITLNLGTWYCWQRACVHCTAAVCALCTACPASFNLKSDCVRFLGCWFACAATNKKKKDQVEWVLKTSSRIWRGSYRNGDWKHLGKGAWAPREAPSKRAHGRSRNKRTQQRRQTDGGSGRSGARRGSSREEGEEDEDEDEGAWAG